MIVLLGCQNQSKESYVSLKNKNNPYELPCYTIELYNVKEIKVRMNNDINDNFPLTLTGVTYEKDVDDQGKIMFVECEKELSYGGINAVYHSNEIDSHTNFPAEPLNIDITNYNIIEINNEIKCQKNGRVDLFSMKSNSQIYDVYLEISFY